MRWIRKYLDRIESKVIERKGLTWDRIKKEINRMHWNGLRMELKRIDCNIK